MFLKKVKNELGEEILEEDYLSSEQEEKFLKCLEELVSGKTKSIGVDQTEALIGLRKEFLRRNLTISGLSKELTYQDKEINSLENDYEFLSEKVIIQYEYNSSLREIIQNLKLSINEMEDKC